MRQKITNSGRQAFYDMNELKGKDFISLKDFSRGELVHILDTAEELKGND
jgi:aspartate carbamoyltransferase catalytic subunit